MPPPEPYAELPPEVTVPLEEVAELVIAAEHSILALADAGIAPGVRERLDRALATLSRRVWDLLAELDDLDDEERP